MPEERSWETRDAAETDWEYGQRPENRSIEERLDNGLVLVDKPDGPTSNQVSAWTRDILDLGKAGHAGTLDPPATGVLPIGLAHGTKVMGPLSEADKEYVTVMTLDEARDRDTIDATAADLVGRISQVPPEKSAVKQEERTRLIHRIDIIEVDGTDVLFRIGCEKGFYVRTFCQQFADAMDTDGAMTWLRRTGYGAFDEDETWSLPTIADEHAFWQNGEDHRLDDIVLPVEAGVRHLPSIIIKDSAVAALTHGADLGATGISKLETGITDGDTVAILTLKGELVAVATAQTDTATMLDTDRTVAELDRVYMDTDTYPRMW